jgi:hypothetical protein
MVYAKDKVAALRPAVEPAEKLGEGLSRRIIRTNQLMSVALDIEGGPWKEPEPFHSHPHASDLIAIPSGVPHSIQLLSRSARLVDTFHPVREDFIKKG